jgi:hypothetical protein
MRRLVPAAMLSILVSAIAPLAVVRADEGYELLARADLEVVP